MTVQEMTVKEMVESEVYGKNYADVMNLVTDYVKPVIETAKTGNTELTMNRYTEMLEKLEVIKNIVGNEKTYQWQYREYNEHYNNWEIASGYVNKFLHESFQQTLVNVLNKVK